MIRRGGLLWRRLCGIGLLSRSLIIFVKGSGGRGSWRRLIRFFRRGIILKSFIGGFWLICGNVRMTRHLCKRHVTYANNTEPPLPHDRPPPERTVHKNYKFNSQSHQNDRHIVTKKELLSHKSNKGILEKLLENDNARSGGQKDRGLGCVDG